MMTRTFLKSKLHRATVTQADLSYEGSLTVDSDLLKAADILEYEKVSGIFCLNGAAARLGEIGDKIIVISYADRSEEEYQNYDPAVILLDENNKIKNIVIQSN